MSPCVLRHNINGLEVFSFYTFDEIEEIVKKKYQNFGDRLLKELSRLCFVPFFENLSLEVPTSLVPIDDRAKNFSHTAVLASVIKAKNISVEYAKLRSTNNIKYAGKSLKYRQTHSKDFVFKPTKHRSIILLDDVFTTGETVKQARNTIETTPQNVKPQTAKTTPHTVLFCVVLCSV